MAKVTCPFCNLPAASVSLLEGRKFHCYHCGWNREIVRKELSIFIKADFVLAALGLVLAVVGRVKNPAVWSPVLMFLGVFCGLPILHIIVLSYQLRKLTTHEFKVDAEIVAAPVPARASRFANLPRQSSPMVTANPAFLGLLTLARPRRVALNARGFLYSVLTVVAVAGYSYCWLPASWKESWHSSSWGEGVTVCILVPAMVYGKTIHFFFQRWRERQLLAHGEIALGRITAQQNHRTTQSVKYCFQDIGGNYVFGDCTDPSRSLYEQMEVPVFYDPDNPKRSVPLDCSLTELDAD